MSGLIPIPVVCALIERDGRVLIAQRPVDKHLPLAWEFPGGKVESGESAEAAIVREIHEELGCTVAIVEALPRFSYDYRRVVIEMIPFVVHLARGSAEPRASEHVAIAWVEPHQLKSYDLAPADWPVAAAWTSRRIADALPPP